MALAHNEWLELNNKQFALYPTIGMLEGMSRQGQFIGLTQRAKQVIKTTYLLGPIIKRIVHWSETGSKGNCMPEKTLIGEVVVLFLGNTTKLDRKKLDRETMFIQHEDLVGILLNGVNHICLKNYHNRYCERLLMNDYTVLPDGMDQVIDEVMEYEPETLVPNIDDHIFDDDDKDNDNMVDVNEKIDTIDVVPTVRDH